MKGEKVFENRFGNFKMREMSDVFEFDDIGLMRHDFTKSFDQMFARNRVSRTVDKKKRLFHSLQSADPARSVRLAFGHITNEFVRDAPSVVELKNLQKFIEFRRGRLRIFAENRSQTLFKARVGNESAEQKTDWADENFLRENRTMSFGKQRAVQETNRLNRKIESLLLAAGEKLLRNRIAVIVRENVNFFDFQMSEQRLQNVRLIERRVIEIRRFG